MLNSVFIKPYTIPAYSNEYVFIDVVVLAAMEIGNIAVAN